MNKRFLNVGQNKENMQTEINIPWAHSPAPKEPGIHVIADQNLEELVPFIDWFYLFYAWRIPGKFPEILEGDSPKAETARKLYADAQKLLAEAIEKKWIQARGIFGVFPVTRSGEGLDLHSEFGTTRFEFLREQEVRDGICKHRSLIDFITPKETDYLGLFAVSAGFNIAEQSAQFKKAGDDYSSILLQSLGGRLTEAFSEKLHQDVMKKYWGYLPEGAKPFGIRPAPGYPTCPDHTEKLAIWKAMHVEEQTGIKLSESYMMIPEYSTCGYYFAHPKSLYFSVGKIADDQIQDYAKRKNWSEEMAKKWLRRE